MAISIPKDAFVIIIGAMKCGTTSLYLYLKEHPEICPAITKEPAFFLDIPGYSVEVEHYQNLWVFDPSVHKYVCEATPGYTDYPHRPNVARKMRDYGIKPKFLYIVRNPFDRIVFHYNFMKHKKWFKLGITDKRLINMSKYYMQLEQYRRYFPRERILLLDFDDLKNEPEALLQTIQNFLGLSCQYLPRDYTVHNPSPVVREFESNLRNTRLGAGLKHFPRSAKWLGKRLLRLLTSPPEKMSLTEAQRNSIRKDLEEDMVQLNREYGFNVQKWGFES